MALSDSTFSNASAAVSDIFAGIGDLQQGALKAQGLDIEAQADQLKAQGDLAEASNYDLASNLSLQNLQYTKASTAIQQSQQERQNTMQIGGEKAAIAGAGFAESGSSLDILRESAQQGALATATLGYQGLITEAGYQEQSQSYQTMSAAARADAAGQEQIAGETRQLASDTQSAADTAAAGSFIGSAIKGAAAIAPFLLL